MCRALHEQDMAVIEELGRALEPLVEELEKRIRLGGSPSKFPTSGNLASFFSNAWKLPRCLFACHCALSSA
jgi:hypothetical protein